MDEQDTTKTPPADPVQPDRPKRPSRWDRMTSQDRRKFEQYLDACRKQELADEEYYRSLK